MDLFDEEIVKFWEALQNNNVRYILVGGFAINLQGFQRFTGDMDIWIDDTTENREKLRAAFRECNMGDYPMLTTMQVVTGWTHFRLNNGLQLDLLVHMKGIEGFSFEECLEVASIADIDGVKVPVLHINQLIANKKAINRPKDQIDVIELEKIKKIRDE